MEDEDEFGDLYTDVLSTFPSKLDASTPVDPPSADSRAIDLNLESKDTDDLLDSNLSKKELDGADNPLNEIRVLPTADMKVERDKDDEGDLLNESNFGIEEDLGSEPAIPGINKTITVATNDDVWEESESDSEDDLQILLNDTQDTNGMMPVSDDEDEDGDPLVIVADDDAASLQPLEDQDWGDDAPHSSELKDSTDASKPNPSLSTVPKIGYNHYGYHPFHSQFKYVRPGAAALPGSSGGVPGQVRPTVNNVSTLGGRGRGEWRPPGMKDSPSQKAFHPGFWGSNSNGRGLDFTLPSHKTIFDVDIDSFEEKPWKYPGVDLSDFFNFGLNEEMWKEFCKQLEQLRLKSTMQSKIRVYESGRPEQEYDPGMPPELALAAGINETSAEIGDMTKVDGGLGDLAKGSARLRPPLLTGRAIQVETGCGERLPSVDTRPPRVRDPDAVIQIVLQDSFDDEAMGNEAEGLPNKDSDREDDQVDVVDEDGLQSGNEYFDGYPTSATDYSRSHVHEGKGDMSSPQRVPSDQHPGSTDHDISENAGSPCVERWKKEKVTSPHMSSGDSALGGRSIDYQREDSVGSMEVKNTPELSSAIPEEETLEREAHAEDIQDDVKHKLHSVKQEKGNSQVEPPLDREEDGVDFKASRSSDNSRGTGSSRDQQKWREGLDDEVVQNGRSSYLGNLKRNYGEGVHDLRRKDREMERNNVKEYYSHRDWDPPHFNAKAESSGHKKEYAEVNWVRRDDDSHGRRIRADDDRHRGKAREVDRIDKDEYHHSRKLMDNGGWKPYHDKDVGLRFREKDKGRHDIIDYHHSNRRKGDDHARKDHVEKEEILFAHKDSSSSRRRRERDVLLGRRKREDQPRMRDDMDDHHTIRVKDESLVYRERGREEWCRPKQSNEEVLSRREKEDGRLHVRSNRNIEDKTLRVEEYKGYDKDTGRHNEHPKRIERVEDEANWPHRGAEDVYVRGNKFANEGKRSRQETSSSRNHKESIKKVRESEGLNTFKQSKRHQGDKSTAKEMGTSEQTMSEYDASLNREGKEEGSSDDELHKSKRGRSKLERWTSHKERDYTVYSKTKELNKDKKSESGVGDESCMKTEAGNQDVDESRTIDGRHLDTVEKLKRRSERFKLPLTSEKDPLTSKKVESEPLACSQNDDAANAQVKLERPPRKRRWISS